MKKVKILLIVLGVSIVVLTGVGFLLPSQWKVERSLLINAPPEALYPLISNFQEGWPQWSAFDYEDKDIQYTYAGPDEGVGAERFWVSKKMGNGSQKITKADPETGIEFELRMEGNDLLIHGKLAFEPAERGTKVTWTDSGDVGSNIPYRYLAQMMDKMMGETFERSLGTLKVKAIEADSINRVP